jgi:hypothetical protein
MLPLTRSPEEAAGTAGTAAAPDAAGCEAGPVAHAVNKPSAPSAAMFIIRRFM